MIPSSIWGPTCDGLDQVVENVLMHDLDLSDWIIFENMGAYTLPVASPFNGFPVPKVHVTADENVWLLLKDILPITEDQFVFGNTPDNLRLGLDIDGSKIDEWNNSSIDLSPSNIIDDPNNSSPFIYEYVEVEPIN